jgi:uncharacterized membrane protein
MTWQILIAITVVFLSVSILLQRILLNKHKINPVAFSATFQGLVGILLIIPVLINGFSVEGYNAVWHIALFSILCYGIGTVVYAKTLQVVEASVFSVLFATHAIWVTVIGVILLGESLTLLQIAGSALIFVSVGLLVQNKQAFSLDRGTILGLITGVLFGFAIASTAYVGREVDTLTWVMISFIGSSVVSLLVSPKSIYKIKPMLNPVVLHKLLILGVLYAIGSVAMVYAYKYGTFSIISPLRQTGIIVTVLLALLFLKPERNRIPRKLAAAFICFAGVVLLVV